MSAPPPLWLDYQRPPPGRQRVGWVLLAVGVLLAVVLYVVSRQWTDEQDVLEQQVSRLQQAMERQRIFADASGSTATNGTANVALTAARWDALFGALEQAGDDSVTLLGLAPGAGVVLISGEARDLLSALAYAQRLQAARQLGDAYLEKYEVQREHPRQPVRFTVQAAWREVAP